MGEEKRSPTKMVDRPEHSFQEVRWTRDDLADCKHLFIPTTCKMNQPSFLQLQTKASLNPIPIGMSPSRNSSEGSISSPSPSQSPAPSPKVSVDIVRCSRCQRSLTLDMSSPNLKGVVPFGMNSYYCNRCAKLVGFAK